MRALAVLAGALLAATTACGQDLGTVDATLAASPPPALSPPTENVATAPGTIAPTATASTSASGPGLEEAAALVERLREFARRPTQEKLDALPLADEVALGLGETVIAVLPEEQLRSPDSWVLEQPLFRAATGPFDLLKPLRDPRPASVSLGAHPHCASPPLPAPEGYADAHRISTQPQEIESCLEWYSVDVFMRDDQVAAVTYDVWEP